MRAFLLVSGLFLISSGAQAQSMRVPPAALAKLAYSKLPEDLQKHLLGIEKKAATIDSYYCAIAREVRNQLRSTTRKYTGDYRFLKPDYFYLRVESESKKDDFCAYLCDSKYYYEYSGLDKNVLRNSLIKPAQELDLLARLFYRLQQSTIYVKPQLRDLFEGKLSAAGFAASIDVSILKADENYIYMELRSRTRVPEWGKERWKERFNAPVHWDDSETMILVVYNDKVKGLSYLPAKIRYTVGQDIEELTFSKHLINPKNITEKDFQFIEPPDGWTKKNFEK